MNQRTPTVVQVRCQRKQRCLQRETHLSSFISGTYEQTAVPAWTPARAMSGGLPPPHLPPSGWLLLASLQGFHNLMATL